MERPASLSDLRIFHRSPGDAPRFQPGTASLLPFRRKDELALLVLPPDFGVSPETDCQFCAPGTVGSLEATAGLVFRVGFCFLFFP